MNWRSLARFALVALLAGCAAPAVLPPSAKSPLLNHSAPHFKRTAVDRATVDTTVLRGRTMVVKFFAEYCEPCKRTLPAAERLHREHPEVVFIGVSADQYAEVARAMGSAYGLTFPIVHDAGRALTGRFRVTELPITFVIDGNGVVRWVGGPAQSERDLEQALAALEP